jgi:hypothetical protein
MLTPQPRQGSSRPRRAGTNTIPRSDRSCGTFEEERGSQFAVIGRSLDRTEFADGLSRCMAD